MKSNLSVLIVGFLFSLGLGLSGMTNPQKVIGFLDIFGEWDPSLMFVMIGAIAVHAVAYKMIRMRQRPLLQSQWHVPEDSKVTPKLIVGSVIFGVGWGLAGYCPGPAITSLGSFQTRPLLFVAAMMAGMYGYKSVVRTR